MSEIRLQGPKGKGGQAVYVFDNEKNILGEGGMGIVYLGKRIAANGTELKVAIKELKIKETDIISRAQREASIQLNHDNLVRMYGIIETEDDDPLRTKNYYVISEYLEGAMLDDVIAGNLANKKGGIYPYIQEFYDSYMNDRNKTATHIVKCILSGVMALHDAGYIHRDIDPTNIMVTSDGKIKLIDFGIAKKLESIQEQKSELTTPGQFIGKAEYAAPELILGDTRHQNYFTDIYAVGILYYQLVVGKVPFIGSKYEVIECQLHKPLPLKNIKSWQIREIIGKATEKKQSDRYASSALFRAAIDNIMYPEPRRMNYRLIGTVAAVVVAVAAVAFALLGNKSGQTETAMADTVKVEKVDPFQMYYNELTFTNEDSIKKGFAGMLKLAEEGNTDAMYEVAYTYAMTLKDDGVGSRARKQALGLKDMIGESQSQDRLATKWLQKTVEATDSQNYKSLYLLGAYYLYGSGGLAADIREAKKLFKAARTRALSEGDDNYVNRIDKTLEGI